MPNTRTRTESTDAERFRIRDRITELVDAAVQANDSEDGPDAQAAAESIMSEFDVRTLHPFATGGAIRGQDITPNVVVVGQSEGIGSVRAAYEQQEPSARPRVVRDNPQA